MTKSPKTPYRLRKIDIILALIIFLGAAAYIAFSNPIVQKSCYIYLLEHGGDSQLRRKAARCLQDFPGKDSIGALLQFVKKVDYKKDREAAVTALTSLCILTGETFGSDFQGSSHNNSIGYPEEDEWPFIAANINDWAFEHGYKDAAERPALSEEKKLLLDQMADTDSKAGARAWTEIGQSYENAESFKRDFERAFCDKRAIRFSIFEESSASGSQGSSGKSFVAQGKSGFASSKVSLARTVGESLRFHVWRLDNAADKYSDLSVRDWWQLYTGQNHLPKAAATWTDAEDPEMAK